MRRLHVILIAAAIGASLAACRREQAAPLTAAPAEVEVAEVTTRDVPIVREWMGTLDGRVNAEIRGQVTGYLLRMRTRKARSSARAN